MQTLILQVQVAEILGFQPVPRCCRSRDHTCRNKGPVSSQLPECRLHREPFLVQWYVPSAKKRTKESYQVQARRPCKPGTQETRFWLWSCTCCWHPPGQAVGSPHSPGRVTALGPPFLWCVNPGEPGPGLSEISALLETESTRSLATHDQAVFWEAQEKKLEIKKSLRWGFRRNINSST